MRLKRAKLVILLVLAFFAVGCTGRTEKSTGIENRGQNGLPSIAAKSPGVPEVGGLEPGDMPLCYSPDLKTVYIMNYSHPDQEVGVILGDYTTPVEEQESPLAFLLSPWPGGPPTVNTWG